MENETIATLTGSAGVATMLGTMVRSLWKTNNGLHEQLREERTSCTERIGKLEERLDSERDDCEERHERMAQRLDKMEDRVRRMTPPSFPKVTP